jgi:hypothetical protein
VPIQYWLNIFVRNPAVIDEKSSTRRGGGQNFSRVHRGRSTICQPRSSGEPNTARPRPSAGGAEL